MLYKRTILPAPDKIVDNGKIAFGTFSGVSKTLDIRGVNSPFYNIPINKFFTNFRIKSRLILAFETDKFIGMVEFFDDKAFGLAQVIFFDKESGKKNSYHKFMGPRRRFVPIDTGKALLISYGKTRYIKIAWNRHRRSLSLSFIVRGDKYRTAAKGKFFSRIKEDAGGELLFVTPAPISRRCSATWAAPLSISGGIGVAKHRRQIKGVPQERGLGLMIVNRTYLRWRSNSVMLLSFFKTSCIKKASLSSENSAENDCTCGEYSPGKNMFYFNKTNQEAASSSLFNDNFLVIEGIVTPLPPVYITNPFGIKKMWIIQDTENMVDLSFTPISVYSKTLNIILMRNAYTTIYGEFNGTLLSANKDKVVLKNCPGLVKKSILRL